MTDGAEACLRRGICACPVDNILSKVFNKLKQSLAWPELFAGKTAPRSIGDGEDNPGKKVKIVNQLKIKVQVEIINDLFIWFARRWINIRITDLDRNRGILLLRKGKCRKGRIVPVSKKVYEKADDYRSSYHPARRFIEGQTGPQYSSERVFRVIKQALIIPV